MNLKRMLLAAVLTALCATPAIGGKSRHGSKNTTGAVPGKFDYYVLALSWQPAFCESHSQKPECRDQSPDRFDSQHLAVHGLWPNKRGDKKHAYGYCGVAAKVKRQDKPESWCSMPKLDLSDGTIHKLSQDMPGYASCLQNHEWYKHGVCSGLKPDAYFATVATLDENIAASRFGSYITANIGKQVSTDSLLAEFEKDFGAGSRSSINLYCEKANGASLLSEVRIYLKNRLPRNGGLAGALTQPDSSERGDCPATITIDKAGLNQ